MAVLEKIRSKSGLAIVVVGGALALFVISDALQSNGRMLGGGPGTTVGEIDGDKIDIRLFEAKVKEAEEMYKMQTQQDNLDQSMVEMLRDQTWNQLVQQNILNKQFTDLGLEVTNDELFDLVQGEDPHPQIKSVPAFQNQETGQFDRTLVVRYLKQLMESNDGQAQAQWAQFEDAMAKEAAAKKYNAILKKGVYATSLEAKEKYNSRSRSVDFEMISMNYFSVPDSSVVAGDSDLKSYFNKHENKYKEKENSRKIDFVLFDVVPTGDDSATIEKWVADQTAQFAAATNDTLYVDLNSDTKFDTVAHPQNYYPEEVVAQLFASPKGTIVGPVFKDGKYQIYKVTGVKEDSLYTMRASHILFKTDGPTIADTLNSLKKAQEVLAQIRNGADFGMMAAQYGTDGTVSRGGDLGWFREGQMVKEFNDAVKRGKKGDLSIVKTPFGIHIVKITGDKTKKLVCAGVVDRVIEPSQQTSNTVFNQASQFAAALAEKIDFDALVAEKGLTKRLADNIKENDRSVGGNPDAREIVRWAFEAKVGDVSDVFSVGDKYIVAKLIGIKEKGKVEFDNVKELVKADYVKEKKAEQLIEKAKTAVTGAANLQDIAAKLQLTVVPVSSQTLENPSIAYVGPDNTFVGTVFGSKPGKVSGPAKGDNAVYIYNVSKFNEAPEQTDFSVYKNEIQSQLSQRVEYGSFDAMKDLNNVKDNRYKFY